MDFESMNLLLKRKPTKKPTDLEVNKKYPLLKMMVLDTKYGPNIKIETPEFFCFIPNRYYQYLKESGVKKIQDMINQGRPIYILSMGAVSKTVNSSSVMYAPAPNTTESQRSYKDPKVTIARFEHEIDAKTFQDGKVRVQCVASLFNIYQSQAEVILEEERPRPRPSSVLGTKDASSGLFSQLVGLYISSGLLFGFVLR